MESATKQTKHKTGRNKKYLKPSWDSYTECKPAECQMISRLMLEKIRHRFFSECLLNDIGAWRAVCRWRRQFVRTNAFVSALSDGSLGSAHIRWRPISDRWLCPQGMKKQVRKTCGVVECYVMLADHLHYMFKVLPDISRPIGLFGFTDNRSLWSYGTCGAAAGIKTKTKKNTCKQSCSKVLCSRLFLHVTTSKTFTQMF